MFHVYKINDNGFFESMLIKEFKSKKEADKYIGNQKIKGLIAFRRKPRAQKHLRVMEN
jgi:Holliday junction resolvase